MNYAFTPESLAERWEVSAATVRSLVRTGDLRAFRVGRQVGGRLEDIGSFAEYIGGSPTLARPAAE
ncbi:MAG: hypothetical protein ACHP84_11000 [Caulobacterales bacterium]